MAGRKRAATSNAKTSRASRTTRGTTSRNESVDIYQQLLVEAEARSDAATSEPPTKRRRRPGEKTSPLVSRNAKAGPLPADELGGDEEEDVEFEDVALPAPTVQTIYKDSDEEDDDDESDEEQLQFEDIDFSFPDLNLNAEQVKEEPPGIQVDLSSRTNPTPKKVVERRKPINKSEKDLRVEIHKVHLLCLLSHVAQRNRWCNDVQVQRSLRKLLNKETIKYLNPGPDLTQFGQTNSLKTGLQKLEEKFRVRYEITERGLRRALWADREEHLQEYRIPDDAESPMDRSVFREVAKILNSSRDVGAQLYCALLRSAGVEARLVCSLQPLSFASGGPSMSRPKTKQKLSLEEQYARRPKYDSSFESPASQAATPIRRRIGHPNATAFNMPVPVTTIVSSQPAETPKKIRESPFPVYWVEVLDIAHQKWQPVDPLVTQSFWKPKVFEPPANERENCMTYVVAFEADGTAKDVTRRYAKAYNAKTRKIRVESVDPRGERWWRKALKTYSRGYTTDLDQIEDNELTAAEAREPMPRNVADFKDHPIYALERHLRRHEVLVPNASAAGTVGAGSKGPLERIYRRKDVRVARTREKWYRLGREVPGDEIPVKFLPKPARRRRDDLWGDDDSDEANDEDSAGTPIFTSEQTVPYKAPPIVNGVVPRNRFGNLDIYVPSMVPEGGSYIADEQASQAAFILGIDYAPALTGFTFRGRKGTAVLHGAVVAVENEEAVRAVIEGLRDVEAEEDRERRTREVLRAWKRFLRSLRVRQRIWDGVDEEAEAEAEEVEAGATDVYMRDEELDDEGSEKEVGRSGSDEDLEGGFVVDDDADYGPGGF